MAVATLASDRPIRADPGSEAETGSPIDGEQENSSALAPNSNEGGRCSGSFAQSSAGLLPLRNAVQKAAVARRPALLEELNLQREDECMTAFERKYFMASQQVWRLSLPAGSIPRSDT